MLLLVSVRSMMAARKLCSEMFLDYIVYFGKGLMASLPPVNFEEISNLQKDEQNLKKECVKITAIFY